MVNKILLKISLFPDSASPPAGNYSVKYTTLEVQLNVFSGTFLSAFELQVFIKLIKVKSVNVS